MTTYTLLFTLERETKGALRYQEADHKPADSVNLVPVTIADGALIGTLYLRKNILGPNIKPSTLRVTIETEDSP